jgi:hypothetical protein
VYCAIEEVVALIEENQRQQDAALASSIQKAERRRASKQRSRERKVAAKETTSIALSAALHSLSTVEKDAYMAIRGILEGEWIKYGDQRIVAALKEHKCDVAGALDSLLLSSGKENSSVQSLQSSQTNIKPELSRDRVIIDCVLPSIRQSIASPKELGAMRPLFDHYVTHIRSRNPGIQVRYDQDFLLYVGHQQQFSLTENPSELRRDIDLHGLTKKPALDVLQSSLLYYHELLAPGKLEHHLSATALVPPVYGKSTFPGRVNAIVVVYVVGQGLHSPGAIPILRNTFVRELSQYWSMFESFIDPANAGQILVKVKRVR